jgi:hypothetical protein
LSYITRCALFALKLCYSQNLGFDFFAALVFAGLLTFNVDHHRMTATTE